jgi:glycosyltransferase involved in cell wall biosynthesis
VRVGLVLPGFSAHDRDWCIPALRDLARTLALTDDVRVISIRYPYERKRYTVDGVESIALGGALSHGRATLKLWRDALDTLRQEHLRRPFDALHAFWATESGLLATLAGRWLGVPTLVSLAGGELVALQDIGYGDQRLPWERVKIAACLRLASGISAGSRLLVGAAERQLRGRRRVHRAPLGIDTRLFTPGQCSPSPTRLVHVASLTPVKDQVTLLRAFACVRRATPSASLDICGEGPNRASLMSLARELSLDGAVRFHGEVDHGQLPPAYGGAAAFVLSSRHEAQSLVCLEAAACGVDVVGTRVGIVPELTSAVAPVGDADALASAIAGVIASSARTTDLADRVRSEFSLETCTDRFRRLYADLR